MPAVPRHWLPRPTGPWQILNGRHPCLPRFVSGIINEGSRHGCRKLMLDLNRSLTLHKRQCKRYWKPLYSLAQNDGDNFRQVMQLAWVHSSRKISRQCDTRRHVVTHLGSFSVHLYRSYYEAQEINYAPKVERARITQGWFTYFETARQANSFHAQIPAHLCLPFWSPGTMISALLHFLIPVEHGYALCTSWKNTKRYWPTPQ